MRGKHERGIEWRSEVATSIVIYLGYIDYYPLGPASFFIFSLGFFSTGIVQI